MPIFVKVKAVSAFVLVSYFLVVSFVSIAWATASPVQTTTASIALIDGHTAGKGHGGGGGFTCPQISGADSSTCSTNWSGYADSVSSGTVSAVQGTWTVPKLSCLSSGSSYVAIWVGIDGFTSNTVEQTGVLGECSNGLASYSAWYEFYPSASVVISSLSVSPGDSVTASVTWVSGSSSFIITITDTTTGNRYSTTGSVSNAARSSAEWIVERPALCTARHCSLTTLAPFDSTTFSSAQATIGSTVGSISGFNDVAITMVGGSSGPILAEPSSLSSDGSSFIDYYGVAP